MRRNDDTIRMRPTSPLDETRTYDKPPRQLPYPDEFPDEADAKNHEPILAPTPTPETTAPQTPTKPEPPAATKPQRTASKRRRPAKRKRRRKPPRGCGCLLFLLFLLLALIGAAAAAWFVAGRNVPPPVTELPAAEARQEAERRAAYNVHILLAGDDERADDEPARSDTIIYTVLRPIDKKVSMVSIPRDTLVDIPGYGEDKINAALSVGDLPLLMETVENLVEAPVDHYVLVNFETFKHVVDAIGGITIDVPERMYKPEEDIDLEPGKQHLNGYQALAFVRWRDDGLGDLGRIERQKTFMAAVMKKSTRLMPWQAARLAWVLQNEVKTDLTLPELLSLTARMAGISGDDLIYESFAHDPQYINGISYVLLNRDDVRSVISRMRYGVDLNTLG